MTEKLNGFMLIDKPPGWTSFDVCAKLRKPLAIKRIGHTGTLDPFATGLLVVAVGKCTKLIPLFEKDKKKYRTKILLGKTSETLDPESEIIDCHDGYIPELLEIEELLKEKFTGKITQIPPKYSALKINGQRAYDLARKGEAVIMKERATEVLNAKVLSYDFPELEVELEVVAGFYVRSFAHDIGTALAGGGMCSELRRIGVGDILINNNQLTINSNKNSFDSPPAGGSGRGADVEVEGEKSEGRRVKGKILTEAELASGGFEVAEYLLDAQLLIKKIVHMSIISERLPDLQAGRAVFVEDVPANGEKVLVLCEGVTVGLAEVKEGNLQPRVVF